LEDQERDEWVPSRRFLREASTAPAVEGAEDRVQLVSDVRGWCEHAPIVARTRTGVQRVVRASRGCSGFLEIRGAA
jgi:hypothetical protein